MPRNFFVFLLISARLITTTENDSSLRINISMALTLSMSTIKIPPRTIIIKRLVFVFVIPGAQLAEPANDADNLEVL